LPTVEEPDPHGWVAKLALKNGNKYGWLKKIFLK
jgi:hypothetical protein